MTFSHIGLSSERNQTGSLPAKTPAPATVNLSSKSATVNCGKDQNGDDYSFYARTLVAHKHPAKAVVGQGYIAPSKKTQGDWVNFAYNQASSHTQASSLGVGLSGYGVSAGYSSSGAKTSTANRGEGYPKQHKDAWFQTEFRVNLYRGLCYEVMADLKVPHVKQHPAKARPKKWLPPGYVNVPGNYHYVHKCYWLVHSPGWFGGQRLSTPARPRARLPVTAHPRSRAVISISTPGRLSTGPTGSLWGQQSASRAST